MKGFFRRLLTPLISTSPMGFLASGTSSQNIARSINRYIIDLMFPRVLAERGASCVLLSSPGFGSRVSDLSHSSTAAGFTSISSVSLQRGRIYRLRVVKYEQAVEY